MKKIIFFISVFSSLCSFAQAGSKLFGKNPIINMENFQKQRLYFGFYLGFNSYDFKIDYQDLSDDIQTKKSTGFNVGLVGNLRLHEYVSLRFEPGLYYTKRDLTYPSSFFATTPSPTDLLREVSSTYLHFPLLLKFSALRTGNVRPFLLGGVSTTLNLSSNSKSIDDNSSNRFRVKATSNNYELGFGMDIFAEYFIFSPSIRGVFGLGDELIRDNNPDGPWTGSVESLKSRAVFINFTFH